MSCYERHHKFLLHLLLLLSILAFREKKESIQSMGSPLEDKAFALGLSMRAQKHEVLTEPRFQLVSQIVLWYHLDHLKFSWKFLSATEKHR